MKNFRIYKLPLSIKKKLHQTPKEWMQAQQITAMMKLKSSDTAFFIRELLNKIDGAINPYMTGKTEYSFIMNEEDQIDVDYNPACYSTHNLDIIDKKNGIQTHYHQSDNNLMYSLSYIDSLLRKITVRHILEKQNKETKCPSEIIWIDCKACSKYQKSIKICYNLLSGQLTFQSDRIDEMNKEILTELVVLLEQSIQVVESMTKKVFKK